MKDGAVNAAETFADAAGNVYHATTGTFLYAGNAVAEAARSAGHSVAVHGRQRLSTPRPAPCCTPASR